MVKTLNQYFNVFKDLILKWGNEYFHSLLQQWITFPIHTNHRNPELCLTALKNKFFLTTARIPHPF